MLELKNITKTYTTGDFKQKALDKVSVNFRECEFASILGPSGSGKTTLLNIIGGLDHYDSGDLIINEISTKKFKDSDWDSYRNHRIGFVFQSYNLISHQSILANVRLALTLSGISKKESNERARKALEEVGLGDHIHKKPNQLSGGQMQRVAIARALVNDPDILLADEPTGALDSETSVQIMGLLKKISKNKLVIMVTHNADLAKEYSTRIINLKDGCITDDSNPYDGKVNTKEELDESNIKSKKTSMSFLTALSLSFDNLMTKKGRTILVSIAGSIGIIGIALIMAVSNGFQNYVDSIQEETLTSYPLVIMEESSDLTGTLLAMATEAGSNDNSNKVKERQFITKTLANIKANDLKSFNKYVNDNYDEIKDDILNIEYSYSVDPNIYTIDATKELAKVNPSTLFNAMGGGLMSMYSSYASIYSQMDVGPEVLDEQYDVLSGRWPKEYNEMVIVLSEPNGISDLLVYSLGLRDTEELTKMVTKIMNGESLSINNEPLEFTYEDLMNIDLRLIPTVDTYKYNSKYDLYEDMTNDKDYMKNLYNNATKLKIVGVVTAKEGVTSMALQPGVSYLPSLVEYLINYAKDKDAVKKQIENKEVDIFSGSRFDSKTNNLDLNFSDLMNIDSNKLSEAFGMKISPDDIQKETSNYMMDISDSLTTDTSKAKNEFTKLLEELSNGVFEGLDIISTSEVEGIVSNYLDKNSDKFKALEEEYVIPSDMYKTTFNGLLGSLLNTYIEAYYGMDPSLTEDVSNKKAKVNPMIINMALPKYLESAPIIGVEEEMGKAMTEAKMKKDVLTKVGELTGNLTKKLASSFKVDENKLASAFTLKLTEDEIKRIVTATMTNTNATAKSNLLLLGYQDIEEPSYISIYFNSFDGKEHFLKFIDSYNEKMEKDGFESKKINYSDTTGILMGSVKTIVNAVSYVLIAFVSISLIVSSFMIGIITYISVYERTKEIGILRSIGASKKNISSIFNAETFIIGFLSGLFGIGISYMLIPIINSILKHFTGNVPIRAMLPIPSAIRLIILSIILTLIGGLIPAKKASNRDPVEALRTE